jgi:preprotein translocase subunit SecD
MPASPRRGLRRLALWIALGLTVLALAVLGGCEPPATVEPVDVAGQHSYSICPQAGELPPKDVTDRAVGILESRLAFLDVATSNVTAGACIDVSASTTSAAQDAAVRAAMLGTGRIELVPITILGPPIEVGDERPRGVDALIDGADIVGSGVVTPSQSGGTALTLRLSPAGGAILESWARVHAGALLAVVVDGVVVALPVINGPIAAELELDLTANEIRSLPLPLSSIEAMVASGPLPPEWEQPERPQG